VGWVVLISCFIDYPPARVFWIAHFIRILTSIHARLPKGHGLLLITYGKWRYYDAWEKGKKGQYSCAAVL
jgi:hypothetical protein